MAGDAPICQLLHQPDPQPYAGKKAETFMNDDERKLLITALNTHFIEIRKTEKYLWENNGTVEELRSVRRELEQTDDLRQRLIERRV